MDKPRINCNNEFARSDLAAIPLTEDDAATAAQPPSTVLEMDVGFRHEQTLRVKIGFTQARIKEYFEGCSAETLGRRMAIQKTETLVRNGRTQQTTVSSMSKLPVRIGRTTAHGRERKFVDDHKTYSASLDGAEPLWEFWPDQGHNFLHVQRTVRIRVVFDSNRLPHGLCRGVISTDCERYVRLADMNDNMLSAFRHWISLTRATGQFNCRDIKASFDVPAKPLEQE